MNTNLVYAVSNFKDFVDNGEWMNDSISTFYNPQSLNKDDIFAIANQCRIGNAAPTFADDTKFLPTNVVAGDAEAVVVSASVTPLAVQSESVTPIATTKTPIQNQITQVSKLSQNDKKLLEYIGIGLGIIVLYKILS
jgi:hypothetical protein